MRDIRPLIKNSIVNITQRQVNVFESQPETNKASFERRRENKFGSFGGNAHKC